MQGPEHEDEKTYDAGDGQYLVVVGLFEDNEADMEDDEVGRLHDGQNFELDNIERVVQEDNMAESDNDEEVVGRVKEDEERKDEIFVVDPPSSECHPFSVGDPVVFCCVIVPQEAADQHKRKYHQEEILQKKVDF